GPWVDDREKQCSCDQQQCCHSSSKLAYVKQLSPLPLEVSLASIQQYCQKLWLNHGKIHRQPNSTVASSAQAIDAPEALLYPSHPIGLEDRVDCLMPRRRDAVFATASQSSSRRRPPSRSFAMEAFIVGGKLATQRSSSAAKSGGNSTPAARPTPIVSCINL